MIVGVVLAAGRGLRFGRPKQLAAFRGRPLLEHAVAALAGSGLDRVIVVLGSHATAIAATADLRGAETVVSGAWREGQAASLRTGVEAAGEAEAVVVTLGDQPLISPAAVARVIAARDGAGAGLRATYGGEPGHPVLLERRIFSAVAGLSGDTGARALTDAGEWRDVPCDGLGSPADVDTPAQLEALERLLKTNDRRGEPVR
jgi:CTP:molybdopterin cytidylyltransferase MocA